MRSHGWALNRNAWGPWKERTHTAKGRGNWRGKAAVCTPSRGAAGGASAAEGTSVSKPQPAGNRTEGGLLPAAWNHPGSRSEVPSSGAAVPPIPKRGHPILCSAPYATLPPSPDPCVCQQHQGADPSPLVSDPSVLLPFALDVSWRAHPVSLLCQVLGVRGNPRSCAACCRRAAGLQPPGLPRGPSVPKSALCPVAAI